LFADSPVETGIARMEADDAFSVLHSFHHQRYNLFEGLISSLDRFSIRAYPLQNLLWD